MSRLERCGLYTGACRLPWQQPGTGPQGLRLGTQEIVRRGATPDQLPALAGLLSDLIRDPLADPDHYQGRIGDLRQSFATDLWGRTATAAAPALAAGM